MKIFLIQFIKIYLSKVNTIAEDLPNKTWVNLSIKVLFDEV